MKLSRDSWHFKMLEKMGWVDCWCKYTICQYFWRLVFAPPVILLVVSMMLVALFLFGTIALSFVMLMASPFIGFFDWVGDLYGLGFVITLILEGVLLFLAFDDTVIKREVPHWLKYLVNKVSNVLPESEVREPVERKPSIFVEYYRSHKEKYCKYIEFVD